jgi:hypothetical protein
LAKIAYEIKRRMVELSGACFWYWNSYHSFLNNSGVPKSFYLQYPKSSYNKYDVMRNVLEALERNNKEEIIHNLVSNFYKLHNAVDRDQLDEEKAKKLLKEFRKVVGNDPIEKEIEKRKKQKAKRDYQKAVQSNKSKQEKLQDINQRFLDLTNLKDFTPQQRGFELEKLFFDLLHISEFEYRPPYRTENGEQIDGHFQYEKFDYLVETKWEQKGAKQKDLSVFDGKIRGKAQSTRGLFISATGFDQNAIIKYSGDSPRIILMTGEDLAMILSGQFSFFDAMKAKIDAIVRYGKILLPVREM